MPPPNGRIGCPEILEGTQGARHAGAARHKGPPTLLDDAVGDRLAVGGGDDQDIGGATRLAGLQPQLTRYVGRPVDDILGDLGAKIDHTDTDRAVPACRAAVARRGRCHLTDEILDDGPETTSLDDDIPQLRYCATGRFLNLTGCLREQASRQRQGKK